MSLSRNSLRLLLISNSTMHGGGYLDHAETQIRDVLGPAKEIVFVPFALSDRRGYTARAKARLATMGYRVHSVEAVVAGRARMEEMDAIFIGGGNTFRLLKALYDVDLLRRIRDLVKRGKPYIGSSAGAIVAGASLKTTKDMPIVEPRSFAALGLVPFQISPHYLDPDPKSTHMGETQEERILQFLEENDPPVVGLREGSMLRIEGKSVALKGPLPVRIFRRGHPPLECLPDSELSNYLKIAARARAGRP